MGFSGWLSRSAGILPANRVTQAFQPVFFVWQGLTCPMFLMDLPKALGVFVDFDSLGTTRAS